MRSERVGVPGSMDLGGNKLNAGSIKDLNEQCLQEFRTHWQCLENHNQQLWNCRSEERRLNKCVFDKLVRTCFVYLSGDALLTGTEIGEDDTRYSQRRDPGSSADAQHLCVALIFVY